MKNRRALFWAFAAPALAAWVPLAYLLAENADQITLWHAGGRCALLLLAANVVGVPLLRLFLGTWPAAAVAMIFLWVLFFTNGPLFDRTWNGQSLESVPVLNQQLLVAALVVFLVGALVVRRFRMRLEAWPRWLAYGALFSVLYSLGSYAVASNRSGPDAGSKMAGPDQPTPAVSASAASLPDVYHVILDGYARADVLRDVYGFDNSEFLHALEQRGFAVLGRSFSNYSMTYLSLSATLNGQYHSATGERSAPGRRHFYSLIQNSWAARQFKDLGYRHHWVGTSWGGTETSPLADQVHQVRSLLFHNEFAAVFWRSTPFRAIEPTVAHSHLHAFDSLEQIAREPAVTYTFAHVLAPHNPYVFDADGNIIANVPQTLQFNRKIFSAGKRWGDKQGYLDQLRYINHRTLAALDVILAQPGPRPIVILQSDHGSAALVHQTKDQARCAYERHGVLNAILAPADVLANWPQPTSVINTYPVLFQRAFHLPLQPRPDRILYSWYGDAFKFMDMTDVLLPADPERLAAAGLVRNPAPSTGE